MIKYNSHKCQLHQLQQTKENVERHASLRAAFDRQALARVAPDRP